MARWSRYDNSLVAYGTLWDTQHLQTPSTSPSRNHSPNSPTAMPHRQAVSHQHEMESHGGGNTASIQALAEHFDRVTAASQQVFLGRLSKQDAILSKQQELLDSLVKLYTDGRNASVEEHETLRIEVSDIRKMTDRLTRGISDAMKILASGSIKAISECQAKLETRLFSVECEELKEEVMDPPANFSALVHPEVAMESDSPIREMSDCDASTGTPRPFELETLSSVQQAHLNPSLQSTTIPHEDELVSKLPSLELGSTITSEEDETLSSVHQAHLNSSLQGTTIPHEDELVSNPPSLELRSTITSEEDELVSTLSNSSSLPLHPTTAEDKEELSSSRSKPTTMHMEDLVSTLFNRQSPELRTTFAHGEEEMVSDASFPDLLLRSPQASTISLPDPSTLLYNYLNCLNETVPHIPSASVPSTIRLSRVDSLSSLSSLSSDDVSSELSKAAPGSWDKALRDAAAGSSTTPKRRRSSPGPSGKLAKRPRNNSLWPKLTVSGDTESRQFIECDKCELWYHWGCVGICDNDPRLHETFECPPCLGSKKQNIHPSPPRKGQRGTCSRPDCNIDESAVGEFFVDKIIGRFGGANRYSWLVKWEGYPVEDSTWTPEADLIDPAKLIEDFYFAAEAEGIPKSRSSLTLLQEAVEAGWATRQA